ncbi:thiamine-phosphate pyrophosphorylase [Roseiarcus fermentans]|uniref:Thiamine-phosphate pyrophosphorylase n=1 Tax=Roseiarcus fermentans TaxID=1473586 RepID=A0A366FU78_9HYPH|nr:thiamine phosphate synthase [Roseiarcus fermentans]RBP18234.1 thiamine-phosphate pyrophosphorylase [Roseiarcus fermentans]
MPPKPVHPPRCSLTLITPPLSPESAPAFAGIFAEAVAAAPVASARVRFAPGADGDARAIVAPLLKAAAAADCALILDGDPRRVARLGADGAHVEGVDEALDAALDSLKPERIVGAGGLRMRDDAMTAGEKGADYVMFGEPRGETPSMALELLLERVGWWAEIFETPCVAYAESIDAARRLAAAGADFVAADDIVWRAASPAEAVRALHAAISVAAAEGA